MGPAIILETRGSGKNKEGFLTAEGTDGTSAAIVKGTDRPNHDGWLPLDEQKLRARQIAKAEPNIPVVIIDLDAKRQTLESRKAP